jgi:ABC-type siderophore export system fused ATPase/permease subunit
MSELRKRTEHLSDRTIAFAVFFLAVMLWIGLVALFANLTGNFLAATTLVMVLGLVANFIVRVRMR